MPRKKLKILLICSRRLEQNPHRPAAFWGVLTNTNNFIQESANIFLEYTDLYLFLCSETWPQIVPKLKRTASALKMLYLKTPDADLLSLLDLKAFYITRDKWRYVECVFYIPFELLIIVWFIFPLIPWSWSWSKPFQTKVWVLKATTFKTSTIVIIQGRPFSFPKLTISSRKGSDLAPQCSHPAQTDTRQCC